MCAIEPELNDAEDRLLGDLSVLAPIVRLICGSMPDWSA